ncbi:unnamed protein product [Periconia digitata]|uniref:Uncharacterized protein n=1 Tax=Periconia digitata TaxID=1303443 RepID=A0A9W4XLF5_9PLEO|nr:unnamed protein product [Periconia digitata]
MSLQNIPLPEWVNRPFGIPPPWWELAFKVPAYQVWAQEGGVAEFARAHGLEPNFTDDVTGIPFEKYVLFRHTVYKIPEVKDLVDMIQEEYEDNRPDINLLLMEDSLYEDSNGEGTPVKDKE